MKEKELLLLRLVELMFEKQQTFLLLDELYEDEIVGTFFRNIQIDSPYQQLLFEGILSQFSQSEELIVNIMVENYFHHLLGLILQKDARYQSSESLIQLVQSNNLKGVKESVSNLLSFDVELGDFNRITELIDLSEGDEAILEICVMPLVNSLLIHGVEKTIEVILENPTENDWKVLFDLDSKLNELQLYILREKYLTELMRNNPLNTKNTIWLGLKALTVFNKSVSLKYLSKLDVLAVFFQEDADLLFQLGKLEDNFGNYDKAIEYYDKCLSIEFKSLGEKHSDVAVTYNNLGLVYDDIGAYEKAIEFYYKSLEINLNNSNIPTTELATNYNNIGTSLFNKGQYEKAINYFLKCLNIQIFIYGSFHPNVAVSFNNIGLVNHENGDLIKSLYYYQKSLEIELKVYGEDSLEVSKSYNNIGLIFSSNKDYENARKYHQKSLEIALNIFGEMNAFVATCYYNIGSLFKHEKKFDKALSNHEKCLEIQLRILSYYHPDIAISYDAIAGVLFKFEGESNIALECYFKSLEIKLKIFGNNHPFVSNVYNNIGMVLIALGKNNKALNFHKKCLKIRLSTFGIESIKTKRALENVNFLYKELGLENSIPKWIKNLN
jgi:tetratricopeptide (TPR) repeat protein